MDVSWRHLGAAERFWFDLVGTKGSATVQPLRVFKDAHGTVIDATPTGAIGRETPFAQSYRAEWTYFLAVIKGDVNAPPPRDQLALHRVLDAVYRSADEGRDVLLTARPRRAAVLIALGAILLELSYPPFRLPLLSFCAVMPAVLLLTHLEREGGLEALRLGFWYGFVAQGLALYWLVVALWHFTPLSALGYLATIAIYGLWMAGLFWLVTRVRIRFPAVPLWVLFPLAWTAMDWGIGHQGDIRFPWLGLGTSLADAPTLVQWADLAGTRGVTLWLAWCNVMLVEACVPRGAWRRGVGRVAVVTATVLLAFGYGQWRARTLPLREVGTVGLIQPNEGFREKWDPAHADSVVAKLVGMSRRALAGSHLDLLVWPEAAIPGW